MKKLRRYLSIIAFVLVASLCISSEAFQIVSSAVGEDIRDSKLYMSDVKMFYGTSRDEAKSACEKEGYIFCPTDLNEGKEVLNLSSYDDIADLIFDRVKMGVYMGYKTTSDPDEAITDLTLLDMKYTHFEKMDYKKYLEDHIEDFRNEAAQMMVLVNELDKKYEAESPAAQMAYDSLNLIYVDENKPHDAEENQLGYYLIHKADLAFFERFIQRGNSQILGKITGLLSNAVADYNNDGATWVERSKKSEIPTKYANASSSEKTRYDQDYEDYAKQLVKILQNFSKTYTKAKRRLDEYGETLGYPELIGMTAENSAEKLAAAGPNCRYPEYADALKTYALLENYTYQQKGEPVINNADLLDKQKESDDEDEDEDESPDETEKEVEVYEKDVSLAEYLMELANDNTIKDHIYIVYPLIQGMTQPQRAALSLSGFNKLVSILFQPENYTANRSDAKAEAMQNLKDHGYSDGRIYLWSGVDNSIYNKKVVQTDARKEAAKSGTRLQNSINEAARKEQDTLAQTLMIIDICTMGYGGVMMIANAILGQTLWALGTNFIEIGGMFMAAEMVGSAVGTAILGGVLCAMWALNVICIVVSLLMLVYTILQAAGVFTKKEMIDFSKIPDVVFDARQSENGIYSVRYDAVRSNVQSAWAPKVKELSDDYQTDRFTDKITEQFAEMNAYMGVYDRWMVMYYSKASEAGEPIEVKPGQEPFVTRNNYQAPDGYRPLSLIISNTAVDVNSVEVGSKKQTGTPLYVFFPGKASGTGVGGEVIPSSTYITEVRLAVAEKQQDALDILKKGNYDYFDVNLTPYSGYTYLGYKRGSEANALRDIRVSNAGTDSIAFGGANYAKMGQDGKATTPDGLALYGTKSECAGTPIVSLTVENKRLELGDGREPVCLFSGGNAVDIGTMWKDNILNCGEDSNEEFFLLRGGWTTYSNSKKAYSYEFISQDDPDNGLYLYFQPKEQFKSTDANGNPAQRYLAGFSYFLAGDKETDKNHNQYGTNYEFMQKFAKSNGFELLQKDGESFRVMSDTAGEMTMGTTWRDVGGYPADTYNFDQFHTITSNNVVAGGDGGLSHGFVNGSAQYVHDYLVREEERLIFHTAMYFGVSYTYNPYRAITGIAGLITSYTETSAQIKYSGMQTPAGTFQACSVNIQGSPINSPGITAGYYHPYTMSFPLYTNYNARQKSDLSWMTDKETEVLTRYLMTSGPREGISPLKVDDILFSMEQKPVEMKDYVPLCDLRTPGDYDHPMNLALDTTNLGSKYLYLYLNKNAGRRIEDIQAASEEEAAATQDETKVLRNNEYQKKQYVAAIFCGVGRNPEEAIANLYANAAGMWSGIAESHSDISSHPLVTEFDEIVPVDLSSEHPWYELHCNDTNIKSLKNGVWVRGNEMAYYRWEGHSRVDSKPVDEYEKDFKCAYVGVVRTDEKSKSAYGVLKYYSDAKTAPGTLNAGSTKCSLAGGPVKSKEGNYYLYYSMNSGTVSYQAPITSIDISSEVFVNGYNTAFTVIESDRKDDKLPEYGQLRMRADEYRYIHMGFERSELPYYEQLYIGVGDSKKEAFIDMVSTTNAYAAMDVDCNYNSYSKKWVAIGYRRTNAINYAITDIFLYSGENPPEKITISGAYKTAKEKDPVTNKRVQVFKEFTDKNGTGVTYNLLKHNLKSGHDIVSLNEGNGGTGLYLYYTRAKFYTEKAVESQMAPITNICFAYGDISPRYATTEQLADVFEKSFYRSKNFDMSVYQDPLWECVMGVEGSPTKWKLTADGAERFSLNKGVLPGFGGNGWTGSDNRVYMFVDRANFKEKTKYKIRNNCKLPETGYYSPTSTFGYLRQSA